MIVDQSVYFKGYRCFKEYAGFDSISPINVIIGKNNSGKSCLLDLIENVSQEKCWNGDGSEKYLFKKILDSNLLVQYFPNKKDGSSLYGNLWESHGKYYAGTEIEWTVSGGNIIIENSTPKDGMNPSNYYFTERIKILLRLLSKERHFLSGKLVQKISAERNILPESQGDAIFVSPDGRGATNTIQNFLYRSDFPLELIRNEVLGDLNKILGSDANFAEIYPRFDRSINSWEIYLSEDNKGLIPLSRSGSGLKTIILVLLNLHVVPVISKRNISDMVYLFEELENNIHPALQRRLYGYIEEYVEKNKCIFFITSHSNIALDCFSSSSNSQIVLVSHDGVGATTHNVVAYFDKVNVISEIGSKASDLLLANGIIWLEGPSDRIYFNRWVEMLCGDLLVEGVDYQCAFFGGSLLANYEATDPDLSRVDMINILNINNNAVLICDGDRTASSGPGSGLKPRVLQIKEQIEKIENSFVWVTLAKEIESYIPNFVLREMWNKPKLPAIGQFESFWHSPSVSNPTKGYYQKHSRAKTVDKVQLATQTAPQLKLDEMRQLFDWEKNMLKIVETICKWNDKESPWGKEKAVQPTS